MSVIEIINSLIGGVIEEVCPRTTIVQDEHGNADIEWPAIGDVRSAVLATIDLSALPGVADQEGFTVAELRSFLTGDERQAMDKALEMAENADLLVKVRLAEISGQRIAPDSGTFIDLLTALVMFDVLTPLKASALLDALGGGE